MKDEVGYGQHIACMLDLMGESEKYRKLESYPLVRTDEQDASFRNDLIGFIKTIENFKSDLNGFLLSAGSPRNPPPDLPESELGLFNEMGGFDVKSQRFSDGILLFSGLMGNPGSGINSLYYIVGGIASTMLMQLVRGTALRGGLALGGGAEIDEGEFFGPAIMLAHEMESKIAIYPRIAVHDSLIGYIHSFDELAEIPKEDKIAAFRYSMASICKSLIVTDFDGVNIIDYAGEAMQKFVFRGNAIDLVHKAKEFSQNSIGHADERIREKYEYLDNYLERSIKKIS